MIKDIRFIKEKGIYYTNKKLALKLIDNLHIDYSRDFTIVEPAIGEGHIMKYVVENYIRTNCKVKTTREIIYFLENNIFGFDNRHDAVEICKKQLTILVCELLKKKVAINWNIQTLDVIKIKKYANLKKKFDYVISNPPYVAKKNLNKNIITFLKKESKFCNQYNYNFYYYFIEIGFWLWNGNGKMVFVTPNSYLKAKSADIMKEFILSGRYFEKIINFENELMFENASTFTAISVFSQNNKFLEIYNKSNELISKNEYLDIIKNKINVFHDINDKQSNYSKLEDIAKVRTGIATLQDRIFIIKGKEVLSANKKYVFFKKKNKTYKVEKKILKNGVRASKKDEKNYLVFPYNSENKKIKDLAKIFPYAYAYLKETLPETYKKKYGMYWGRTQGINDYSVSKIIIPRNIKLKDKIFEICEYGLIISGIYIVVNNKSIDSSKLISYLNSNYVKKWILKYSQLYVPDYKSISSTIIKKIPINQEKLK